LHGKKYLIRGNHDKSCKGLENYFEWVGDIKEAKFSHEQFPFIDINETFCVEMCHYPLMAWNRRTHGACHAHGHVHSALDKLNEESEELRVDVGIDGALADYNLIDLETLYSHFRAIIERAGCKTFQEYAEWLMAKQGYRI
jgi:calcineurin-like phosphoesterase family protein